MKIKSIMLLCAFLLCFFGTTVHSATYSLRFITVAIDTVARTYTLKVQIQATDTAYGMGGANLTFTYNSTIMAQTASPVSGCTWHNYNTGLYSGNTVTRPVVGRMSVNIVWNGNAGVDVGQTVPLGTWVDIVTIPFTWNSTTPANALDSAVWTWRTATPNPTICYNDKNMLQTRGTLNNVGYHYLPVELVSFEVHAIDGAVALNWKTATEVNNEGFDILRSVSPTANITKWEGVGYVEGHGSSSVPHEYSYTDRSIPSGGELFYRLRQNDRDGSFNYSQIVRVQLGGVNEFKLYPAYPNPFTSSTAISFTIPAQQHVTVQVFDATGQMVDQVLDQEMQAGFHTVGFNASNLAPGAYRFTVMAGNTVKHGKMVLSR
jgi:hypothetical protein